MSNLCKEDVCIIYMQGCLETRMQWCQEVPVDTVAMRGMNILHSFVLVLSSFITWYVTLEGTRRRNVYLDSRSFTKMPDGKFLIARLHWARVEAVPRACRRENRTRLCPFVGICFTMPKSGTAILPRWSWISDPTHVRSAFQDARTGLAFRVQV